jgi:hypothetical protein
MMQAMISVRQLLVFFCPSKNDKNRFILQGFRLSAMSKSRTVAYLRVSTADQDLDKNLGRPSGSGKSKLDKFRPEIEALMAKGATQKFVAQRYGTTEANLSRWLKKHGLRRERR